MPIWLLNFFAGAGAVSLVAMLISLLGLMKKDRIERSTARDIQLLHDMLTALEKMCEANKIASDKQMDALMEMGKSLKSTNTQMSAIWVRMQELADRYKETGPDG